MKNSLRSESVRFARMAERVKRATDELVASLYNTDARDAKLRYDHHPYHFVSRLGFLLPYTREDVPALIQFLYR
jgi:hypothetical protein